MVLAKVLKKERNFAGQIVTFFYESLFVKPNHTHTDIENQTEASKIDYVSSMSVHESK